MTPPPTLFDAPEVCHAAMVDGIDTAAANAAAAWAERAASCIRVVAERGNPFTTDDVLTELARWPESTHNTAALGPIMQRLEREHVIVNTGDRRRPKMAQRHRMLTCWKAAS